MSASARLRSALLASALLGGLAWTGCGGDRDGDDADGDADADADADGDGDADGDACGSGSDGRPSVAWAITGGGAEDDVLADLALERDCGGLVAAINHRGPFTIEGLALDGGDSWSSAVIRFDAEGTRTWSVPISGDANALLSAVVTTEDGSTWAGGSFEGSAVIGGEAVTAVGDDDAFAVRIGPDGSVEELTLIASPGSDVVFTAAATAAGGVILAGAFGGPMTVAGRAIDVVTPAQDIWVAELDAEGSATWVATWGGSGNHNAGYEYPRAVARSDGGDLLVAGRLANAATPGDWTEDNVAFATHLDANGDVDWTQEIPWGYGNWGEISASSLGDDGFVLGGGFDEVLELGGVSLADAVAAGLVARLDGAGAAEWVTLIDGPGEENVRDVAAGAAGEIVAIGDLSTGTDLGDGSIEAVSTDVFVIGLASESGDIGWSLVWPGSGEDRGTALDTNARGLVAVGGEHSSSMTLGGEALASEGGRDVWIGLLRR